ncbi:MAG: type II toxin-antitoxin system VapC family toxin [Gammaproteobacteria bacterium]|nr:type II toxin-antitoxin system VapC family toxin [Gammaproteobacteria bacterium]
MKLLLDTQIYLWVLDDSSRLSERARALIQAADQVLISAATIWEAAIKNALGKLRVDPALLVSEIARSGFTELPILARHAAAVSALPMHHKDPFDRLLIAQALTEPARLLTADSILRSYSELVETVS